MHREVLIPEQIGLLSTIGKFSKKFGLVGATAVALQIGHRESIDLDLLSLKEFDLSKLK